MRRLLPLLLFAACTRTSPAPQQESQAPARVSEAEGPVEPTRPIEARPLVRCFPEDRPLDRRDREELLDAALDSLGRGDPSRALACAEEGLRAREDDPDAARLRALALVHAGRYEEARDAYVLALALAPGDPAVLVGIADLYANFLPPSRERTLAALAWVERALSSPTDDELRQRMHLLAAWVHADLRNFRPSLAHAQAAAALDPEDVDPLLAQGLAYYELTRFDKALKVLDRVLQKAPQDAEAHFLLGLCLERLAGRGDEARAHLELATRLDPEGYPSPLPVDSQRLAQLAGEELQAIPERWILETAGVSIRVEELPSLVDLRAEDPPLSPTAVGMFRGPPLGVDSPDRREILLFSRNMARAARDEAELREQVRITLLHEIAHLQGEDEADLRARGLD